MQVKMRTNYAGPEGNHDPGAVVDFDGKTARRLIYGGFAEAVDEPRPRRSPKTTDDEAGSDVGEQG